MLSPENTNIENKLTAEAFRAKSIKQWNNLPMELRTEVRIMIFKKNFKTWLKERRNIDFEVHPD